MPASYEIFRWHESCYSNIYIFAYVFTMMKQIHSIGQLTDELKNNSLVYLLLAKIGSDQSDCALNNFMDASNDLSGVMLLWADVNQVRDIHPRYEVTTVPSLLEFRNGEMSNVIKGCHRPEQFKAIFENTIFVPASADVQKPVRSVTVYTTPTCSWCTTLKRHLDVHQVRYREVDVSKDQKAAEAMMRKSGQQGVPQTEINGQMIVGFDRDKINRLLDIK